MLPAHRSALNDLIDQHELLGTPVITFHGDAPGSERSAYVGPNARRSGALAGEALAKFMDGRGSVLSFAGDQGRYQPTGRYESFRAELAGYGGHIQEAACAVWLGFKGELPKELEAALGAANGIYVGDGLLQSAARTSQRRASQPVHHRSALGSAQPAPV
jgi:ABC-type sugar transport system substrate-binding protein